MIAQLTWCLLQNVDQPGGAVKVYAADIDNNGTLDLISARTTSGINWYSNDAAAISPLLRSWCKVEHNALSNKHKKKGCQRTPFFISKYRPKII
jgi:hypothetical protein